MATTYAYLVDPNKQYMTKSGTINVNGTLRVYDAATDDIVITYKDFNGTENEASINLDNNGRAIVIADSSRAYRLEVYDRYGSLQWTVSPLWCLAAGGGVNISRTEIISTDGSIDIDKVTVGSTTTFDIGLAPNDSDEFLEWITCSEEDCGSTWYPVYQSGTMETEAGQGVKVHGGHLYHFTNSFTVDPNGSGINYDTFRVTMYCGDEIVDMRDFDIDSSLNDAVLCEFSRDVVPTEDTHVYFKLTIPSTCEVSAEVQCHRIYSGINAVPDTCATKQWVQETFDYNMAEKISYSALEYNGSGYISGISGSAIAGGLDSATVSAIASSYAESAISSISGWSGDFSSISSKVDQSAFDQCCDEVHSALDEKLDKSASSEFQPSGEYVYESAYSSFSSEVTNNISSISSTVSGLTGQYIEQSASGMFQPSGHYASASDLSAYVPFSGIEGEGGRVTGISGSAIKGHEYTGINPVTVDNTADTISVEHRTLCVDSTMTAYNSGSSAVIGVNVAGLDLSSKMDASASSLFYSTSNPSGFIDGASASVIASAYAESAASSKQDTLTFSYDADKISAINGSALAGQGGGGLVTAIGTSESGITSINDSGLVDTAALHSSDYSSLYVQEPLYISSTGDSSYIGISGDVGGIDSATCSAIASAYAESAASSKQDTLSFGYDDDKISAINGSALAGEAQAVSAVGTETAYTPDGVSDVVTSINGNYISALSADSAFQASYDEAGRELTSLASEYEVSSIASSYAESAASSKQDTLTFDWDADSAISSINGSALAGQGGVGASIPFTGYYYDSAASATTSITADVTAVSSLAYTRYNGTTVNAYKGITDSLGNHHLGVASFIDAGAEVNGKNASTPYTMAFAPISSMWTTATVATGIFSPLQYGTGAGMFLDNGLFKGYLKGNEWFVSNTAYGYARGEVHQSRGSRVIVEHTGGAGAVLSAKGNQANVTLNTTSYGTAKMAVANSQAYVQVQRGDSAFKYNSAKLDTDYLKFYNGMTTGYLDPEDTASGTAYMPAETEYMYISSIPYWNAKLDASAIECDMASAITAIGGSAIAGGGGGGVDSATVSAIASSYAESAVSSKADSSALSSYALSADVSGTVDLVSTQSANWGGSALALSAGPGVKLEKVGDTLVASTDETVLWSGETTSITGITLNESYANFERVRFYWNPWTDTMSWQVTDVPGIVSYINLSCGWANNSQRAFFVYQFSSTDKLNFSQVNGAFTNITGTTWTTSTACKVYKVVGINRTAEA